MHEPEPGVIDVVVGIVFEMPCEGVDESAGIVAMPGMDHESRRLVDDENSLVFIDYIERDILCYYLKFIARTIHHDAHDIVGLHLVARLRGFAVDDYASGVGRLLNTVAGGLLHTVDEKLVDSYHLLALIRHETEMLIELLAVVADIRRLLHQLVGRGQS